METRSQRINRDFEAYFRQTILLQVGGAVICTLCNLFLFGFFAGYDVQRSNETFLGQIEFSNSSWFEIVSEAPVEGRFVQCDEPFTLYGEGEEFDAIEIEGRNAACQEYGLSMSLGQGKWYFRNLKSAGPATPTTQIWAVDPLVVHTEKPLANKVVEPIAMFVAVLFALMVVGYVITALEDKYHEGW